MKIAVIGGVSSTRLLIAKLAQHDLRDVSVWGYEPDDHSLVSGWANLEAEAKLRGFLYEPFVRVADCLDSIRVFAPDIIFAVGLSQLIPDDILQVSSLANIGFHPTALPKGRGRAAMAWMILDNAPGAATFFLLNNGVDSGPILEQEIFSIDDTDDVSSIEHKILMAQSIALDRLLPRIVLADISAVQQDEAQATWYGRRAPEDGCIDWHAGAEDILRLVRASAPPHPGAFTFHEDHRIQILSARLCSRPEKGVVGRILQVAEDSAFVVQTGSGLIQVEQWQTDMSWQPRVGQRLGYYCQLEIYNIRKRLKAIERQLLILGSR